MAGGSRLTRAFAAGGVAAVVAVPLGAALLLALAQGLDAVAWRELLAQPGLGRALALSLSIGTASTALALLLVLWLTVALHGTRTWQRLGAAVGPMLALPHAAFAIGLGLLVMPSGWLARLFAPLAGWDVPPAWESVNDPRGLAMLAVLIFKETPFLLLNVLVLFNRPEVAAALHGQRLAARTLGYSPVSAWWRVIWPQWLPRLAWPLVAVLAYGCTVVDVALVIGPESPPPLAVWAWQWLLDANPARNAQGAAATLLLAGAVAAVALVAAAAARALSAAWGAFVRRGVRGPVGRAGAAWLVRARRGVVALLAAVYVAAVLALAMGSLAGAWTFPDLWPHAWSGRAWQAAASSWPVVAFTLALGVAASLAAVALAVLWMENTAAHWDRRAAPVIFAPMLVPSLLLSTGAYQVALHAGADGRVWSLWWMHVLMALPCAVGVLAPAWRSFDPRWRWTAATLNPSRAAFWLRIKGPMLKAPLAAALAVCFAVSVAQYLPTQFLGAGRHATVTTEAVTLAAGGQRPLAAAFALLQALLPMAVFAAAWAVVRRRVP